MSLNVCVYLHVCVRQTSVETVTSVNKCPTGSTGGGEGETRVLCDPSRSRAVIRELLSTLSSTNQLLYTYAPKHTHVGYDDTRFSWLPHAMTETLYPNLLFLIPVPRLKWYKHSQSCVGTNKFKHAHEQTVSLTSWSEIMGCENDVGSKALAEKKKNHSAKASASEWTDAVFRSVNF